MKKTTFEKHREYDYDIKPKVGDVWWIDYGDNLKPELSFRHMGIIIAKKGKSFLAIPITTKRDDNPMHVDAFHPVLNVSGKRNYYLLKEEDFSFLKHDSVAKCCELKTVSVKRLYSFVYHFNQRDAFFLDLIDTIHKNFFSTYDYQINTYMKENSKLKMQLYLTTLKDSYIAKSFDDFTNQLSVPSEYIVEPKIPHTISKNTYEYILAVTDKYGQKENKKITYIIK